MKRVFIGLLTVISLLCGVVHASTLTISLSQVEPAETTRFGGGLTSELNREDLLFYAPFPKDLSRVERVMVLGGTMNGTSISGWYREVLGECRSYYWRNGVVPTTLSPDILAENHETNEREAESYSFFKNPFSGGWVRCNAAEPSAGDIYCRPLNTEETQHVAQGDQQLSGILQGVAGGTTKLAGEVWYVRIYGEGGRVIWAGVDYIWSTSR
jgi:hypothetical protein